MVLDGAGWHRSPRVELPERINLQLLPPYSTELQPASRLWKLVDEPLINEHFDSLEEIEQVLASRCRVQT